MECGRQSNFLTQFPLNIANIHKLYTRRKIFGKITESQFCRDAKKPEFNNYILNRIA